MLPALKSEFRKLFTIRSTYVMVALSLIIIAFFCFYLEGYKGQIETSPASKLAPTAIQEIVRNYASIGTIFVALIAILFVAHEYRYNTIMYTLTANARRTRVLVAKILSIAMFSVVYAVLAFGFAIACYYLGLILRDAHLPAQNFDLLTQLGKMVVYFIAYALLGLLIATLVRSVVAAIAIFLVFPSTIEPLLGLVLKDNAVYLPYAAIDKIIGSGTVHGDLSTSAAIAVATTYLVIGWLIAWLLFLRRDAN